MTSPLLKSKRVNLDEWLEIMDKWAKETMAEAPCEIATAGQIDG